MRRWDSTLLRMCERCLLSRGRSFTIYVALSLPRAIKIQFDILTSFMFLYNRSLFLSRKPRIFAKERAVSQLEIILKGKKKELRCSSNRAWHWGVFYPQHSRWPPRHNARGGNLLSPASSVSFCQPVCACSQRGEKRQTEQGWCRAGVFIKTLCRCKVCSKAEKLNTQIKYIFVKLCGSSLSWIPHQLGNNVGNESRWILSKCTSGQWKDAD